MKGIPFIALLVLLSATTFGNDGPNGDTVIYLFPGQGSDFRLYKHLVLPSGYDPEGVDFLLRTENRIHFC